MGHYCNVCGRERSNEKFSGKGHKKHICKDCSGKPKEVQRKMMEELENDLSELDFLFGADIEIESDDELYMDGELEDEEYINDDEIPF